MRKSTLTVFLILVLVITACNTSTFKNATDLMPDTKKDNITTIKQSNLNDPEVSRKNEIINFSLQIFRNNFDDKNILISPFSIISALGMVTNGATGKTLLQLEQAFDSDIQKLNEYLKAYKEYLPSSKKYEVNFANSIWFKDKDSLKVNEDFLQINKDYYDASVYKAPFDESTKDDINMWVSNMTNKIIESLLDEPPSPDTVMYLINALSFDAEWEDVYEKLQITKGEFFLENGERQDVDFMNSLENVYLENDVATGIMKPYKDNKYAFVALLPKVNISMSELLISLDAKEIMTLIENQKKETVLLKLPKFSVEYSENLNDSLKNLGITDGFDEQKADFSKLANSTDGNIFISRVIHKTKIDVYEKGTKAGAVTSVEMDATGAIIETKEVFLDRPFFYMIIDTKQNLPLFIGSLMNLE